jgi:site-specific recombinase XerD
LRSLQKILGHSRLDTTEIYLDVVGTDIKDDFDKVEW